MIAVKLTNGEVLFVGDGTFINMIEDNGEFLININGCYAATRDTKEAAQLTIDKVTAKILEGGVTIIVIDDY